jgi:hypothetical protein
MITDDSDDAVNRSTTRRIARWLLEALVAGASANPCALRPETDSVEWTNHRTTRDKDGEPS